MRLAATADVVVEAFRPGVVDRLGNGPDQVRRVNPRVVYASISAFGQTGPQRDVPAHDVVIEALAGVVSLDLGNDGQPANPHMPVADITGPMTALAAILAAVNRPDLIPAATGPNGPGQEPVRKALAALFLTRTRDAWDDGARGRDLAFAPVLALKEAFDQPQATARGMLLRDAEGNPHVGTPVKYRDEPGQPDLTVPTLDQHGPHYRG
jgi:crotonobetainyl-CoA:carnitine CoA-transferase CaiB-like acyl-CoA transferase